MEYESSCNPLFMATHYGNLSIIKWIIEDLKINYTNIFLIDSLITPNIDIIKYILSKINMNVKTKYYRIEDSDSNSEYEYDSDTDEVLIDTKQYIQNHITSQLYINEYIDTFYWLFAETKADNYGCLLKHSMQGKNLKLIDFLYKNNTCHDPREFIQQAFIHKNFVAIKYFYQKNPDIKINTGYHIMTCDLEFVKFAFEAKGKIPNIKHLAYSIRAGSDKCFKYVLNLFKVRKTNQQEDDFLALFNFAVELGHVNIAKMLMKKYSSYKYMSYANIKVTLKEDLGSVLLQIANSTESELIYAINKKFPNIRQKINK